MQRRKCVKITVFGNLKKFMGKEYMGVVRTTFIINPEGKIAAIWDKVNVRKKKNCKR